MNSPSRLVSFRAVAGVITVTALAVGALVLVHGNGTDSPVPPTPSSTHHADHHAVHHRPHRGFAHDHIPP